MFIELDRRFYDFAEGELEDTELLLSMSEHSFDPGIGWPELLDCARVILMAEAGAGKTREMKEQADRLAKTGTPAFFGPLEDLDRGPFPDLLSPEEERRFETWKTEGAEPAWFFLDAVDELKLTQGKLDRALRRFSKDIDGHLSRAHIFISCRPSDWRPEFDLATVREWLPVPAKSADVSVRSPEETFLDAFAPSGIGLPEPGDYHKATAAQKAPESVRTVVMLPMSDAMIERFARKSTVQDAAAFLKEIKRQNAWTFARRPMDLITLAAPWTNSRLLGTLERQHEANVETKLKDDTDRADSDVLCDVRAREGAEVLALGLALTRTRTIRSPEQALDTERADEVLDAAKALPRWTVAQRRSLLRRALFDPATYGRVRFHHRSVQEYLAARCLHRLRKQGMPTRNLFRLLFAERYGLHVVLPSMRAIAAWLALWEPHVRKELLEREPEALVLEGDPGSLDLPVRGKVVHAFVDKYGRGDERGLNLGEVRRLAHPDLAPVIRRCWGHEPANEDVLSLLLALIRFGPVEACADLAAATARKTTWAPYHRIMAIRVLVACGRRSELRGIVDAMLEHPEAWPDKIVNGVLADLFPKFVGAECAIALMERANEPQQGGIDFAQQLHRIVEAVDPLSDAAVSLRDGLAELIWRERAPVRDFLNIRSKFEHLAPPLAAICDLQLSGPAPEPALIRACVIASRFGSRLSMPKEAVQRLRRRFIKALRSEAFWAELKFMDAAVPVDDDRQRWVHTACNCLTGSLKATDRSWLLKALADRSQANRRPVALWALLGTWHRHGRSPEERHVIQGALEGDPVLESIMEKFEAPPEPDEGTRNDEFVRLAQKDIEADARRLENWKNWREKLIAEPDEAFSPERLRLTLVNLHEWLKKAGRRQNRLDVWDRNALSRAFGPDIANRAVRALAAFWRAVRPVLWSERPHAARNGNNALPGDWILGLMGVSAEAEAPRWTETLSPEEAKRAVAYATIELNGFAPFIDDLARSRPEEVKEVIGSETGAELRLGHERDYLPTLNNLALSNAELQTLLAPCLAAELASWPVGFPDPDNARYVNHLDRVLGLLRRGGADRTQIARLCGERFRDDPGSVLALVWLRGLVWSDPVQGAQMLIESIAGGNGGAHGAVKTFARIYGSLGAVDTNVPDPSERVDVLERLVRCAYSFIRLEDDLLGVHSPRDREAAQRARECLLNLLLDTPGPEARRAVRRLANEAEFADERDRLLLLNRDQTALDAEFPPFAAEDVAALLERLEVPPRDRDGLFAVMLNRLDDLAHDIMHGDFSDRQTWRKIDTETEMQRTLATRLDLMAKNAYEVTREEEVADGKRTDIRLVTEEHKAVIEVKIADRWSLKELERALREQLLGRYMRHRDCKAGCLLLTYLGEKSWWVGAGKHERLKFRDVIGFLEERAAEIEREHDVRVAVFGMDLASAQVMAINSRT